MLASPHLLKYVAIKSMWSCASVVAEAGGIRLHLVLYLPLVVRDGITLSGFALHCPGLEGKGVMRGYLRADPLTADLETASLLLTGRLKAAGAAGRSAVRGSPALSVVGVRGALH